MFFSFFFLLGSELEYIATCASQLDSKEVNKSPPQLYEYFDISSRGNRFIHQGCKCCEVFEDTEHRDHVTINIFGRGKNIRKKKIFANFQSSIY